MDESNMKNTYLEQVKAEQQQIEVDLRAKRAPQAPLPPARARITLGDDESVALREGAALVAQAPALDVRVVGFWRWKTVIVPPNAYVVHTRRGQADPLHLGLGISFRFNPYTDSFLVVPSAMQTILINAHCICRELQGLLVQGYVQWIIADFATAYKKLDFSDAYDPMRVVNVQLREQAEAAIKDKVATMSIDDVLSDKQPIIQELTARLRHVAEGEGDSDKGLGLRIVTVQIKEAVVSSTRLWENLQEPFRAERGRIARLAKLAAESVVQAQELEHENARATARIENDSQLAKLRAIKEAEAFDREQSERARRHEKEQQVARKTIIERNETLQQEQKSKSELDAAIIEQSMSLERANAALELLRLEKSAERTRLQLNEELARKQRAAETELAMQAAANEIVNQQTRTEIELEATQLTAYNGLSPAHLQALLIEALPAIMEKLPKPDELRAVSIGAGTDGHNGQALTALVAQILGVLDTFRARQKE